MARRRIPRPAGQQRQRSLQPRQHG
jgi:hypothetical protein